MLLMRYDAADFSTDKKNACHSYWKHDDNKGQK